MLGSGGFRSESAAIIAAVPSTRRQFMELIPQLRIWQIERAFARFGQRNKRLARAIGAVAMSRWSASASPGAEEGIAQRAATLVMADDSLQVSIVRLNIREREGHATIGIARRASMRRTREQPAVIEPLRS
jgi:hypothetical protein